jgi:hypothetical protein
MHLSEETRSPTAVSSGMCEKEEGKMISFTLKSGRMVIPTSFHGSRFSDGTVFNPSEEEIKSIKDFWGERTVKREFKPVESKFSGITVVESTQRVTDEALEKLRGVQADHPEAIILASFMLVSALKEMGIRDQFPNVLCTNATEATSRAANVDKVWDVNKFAW